MKKCSLKWKCFFHFEIENIVVLKWKTFWQFNFSCERMCGYGNFSRSELVWKNSEFLLRGNLKLTRSLMYLLDFLMAMSSYFKILQRKSFLERSN